MYRGLLFSLYALHNDFLSVDQLHASIQAWVGDRSKTVDVILVEQSALTDRQRNILWLLVDLVLEKYDGDEARAIHCLSWAAPIREALLPLVNNDSEMLRLVSMIGEPSLANGNALEVDPWSTWLPNLEAEPGATPLASVTGSQPVEPVPSKNTVEVVDSDQFAAADQDPFATLF